MVSPKSSVKRAASKQPTTPATPASEPSPSSKHSSTKSNPAILESLFNVLAFGVTGYFSSISSVILAVLAIPLSDAIFNALFALFFGLGLVFAVMNPAALVLVAIGLLLSILSLFVHNILEFSIYPIADAARAKQPLPKWLPLEGSNLRSAFLYFLLDSLINLLLVCIAALPLAIAFMNFNVASNLGNPSTALLLFAKSLWANPLYLAAAILAVLFAILLRLLASFFLQFTQYFLVLGEGSERSLIASVTKSIRLVVRNLVPVLAFDISIIVIELCFTLPVLFVGMIISYFVSMILMAFTIMLILLGPLGIVIVLLLSIVVQFFIKLGEGVFLAVVFDAPVLFSKIAMWRWLLEQ